MTYHVDDEKNGSAHVRPLKLHSFTNQKIWTQPFLSYCGRLSQGVHWEAPTKQSYLGESLEKEFKLLRDVDYVVIKNYNLKQDWGEAI